MDIIEVMEIKISNFVKDWIKNKPRERADGPRVIVKTVHVVPFSNIITINKGTTTEAARTYKSFPDPHFQKMLKEHKAYFVEAFKQDNKEPRIYKMGFNIDDTFMSNRMAYGN